MEFAGGNKSEFRDAYLGWTGLPILQEVLLGNQKRPYGLDHLNSSRYNVFIERPFVIEGFNQDARRLGLQSYGLSEDQAWNWRYGVFNQRNVQALGNYIDDHLQLQVAGRLAHTMWYDEYSGGRGYAHWAVSGTHADSTTEASPNEARFRTRPEARSDGRWLDTGAIDGADSYELLGLESVVNVGAFQVVDETKKCFTVEEDVICIPRVVFPWQKTACNPCPNNGSFIKKVKLLGTKKYKCPKCEYSWTPEKVPACGCHGGCSTGCGCGGGYDRVKLAPELPAKASPSVPTVALAADTFETPVDETWVSTVDSSDEESRAAEFAPVHIEPVHIDPIR